MKRTLFVAAMCGITMMLCPGPGEAQTLKLSIGPVQVVAGQMVTIPLRVTGAAVAGNLRETLGSLECEVVFDTTVFEVQGIEKGPLLGPYNTLEANPALAPGRAKLVLLNQQPIGATGIVAEIRGFVRGEPGRTTQLTIENAEASSLEPSLPIPKIPVEIVNGMLTVVAGTDTTGAAGAVSPGDGGGIVVPKFGGSSPVLLGAVFVLGAVALGLGILILRRRKP